MWYLQLGTKHTLSSWHAIQYSLLTIYFSEVVAETKRLFFEKFVWKLGITCNITAAIWLLQRFLNKWIWKTRYYYFLYKPTKKGKMLHKWKCHVIMTKKWRNILIWKIHVTMTMKDAYISNEMQLQNHSLTSFRKTNHFFQPSSFYLVHPWLTTLLAPWRSLLVPTMWTLAIVKTDLDDFLGPKTIPTTCM